MLPLPSLKLIGAGVVLAALIGAFFFGRSVGIDSVLADQAREDQIVAKVTEAAQKAAAGEIAKIEVKNVVVKQRVETEVRTVPVYSDCRNTTVGMQLINAAITGAESEPAGDSQLPGTPAPDGR